MKSLLAEVVYFLAAAPGLALAVAGIAFLCNGLYGIVKVVAIAPRRVAIAPSRVDIGRVAIAPSRVDNGRVAIAPKFSDSIDSIVVRKELSSKIGEILDRNKVFGGSTIIYGAKGAGKSTIVDNVIQGRLGVTKIEVDSKTSRSEIISQLNRQITERTGTEEPKERSIFKGLKFNKVRDPRIDDFIDAMMMEVSGTVTVPTIIFEIERETEGVRSIAKVLSTVCSVVLILSEAYVALDFGRDRPREKFIFVGEFIELEAREYLTKILKLELSESDIKHVLDNIGANPATLADMGNMMARDGISVQDFVALELERATEELVAFQHQQILKALKEHPEGVSAAYFKKMRSEHVDLSVPRAVAIAMMGSNALLAYRIELCKYVMLSRTHEVALKTYEPILPLPSADTATLQRR